MTQITQGAVADALDARLASFGPSGGDINTEGDTYTPQAGRPYLASNLQTYSRTPLGVGPNVPHAVAGTYLIRVNRPAASGLEQARGIAARLVLLFGRGTALTLATGQSLIIEQAGEGPVIAGADWLTVPVTASFYVTE